MEMNYQPMPMLFFYWMNQQPVDQYFPFLQDQLIVSPSQEFPNISQPQQHNQPRKSQKMIRERGGRAQDDNLAVSCQKVIQKNIQTKKNKHDEDFAQRRQTPNRNLRSNTFKIYLQQVRSQKSEAHLSLQKIFEGFSGSLTLGEFLTILEEEFPVTATYYSFEKVWGICKEKRNWANKQFAYILRKSLRRFFLYEIHMVGVRSVRTTKKIRGMQIKEGKELIKEMSHSK